MSYRWQSGVQRSQITYLSQRRIDPLPLPTDAARMTLNKFLRETATEDEHCNIHVCEFSGEYPCKDSYKKFYGENHSNSNFERSLRFCTSRKSNRNYLEGLPGNFEKIEYNLLLESCEPENFVFFHFSRVIYKSRNTLRHLEIPYLENDLRKILTAISECTAIKFLNIGYIPYYFDRNEFHFRIPKLDILPGPFPSAMSLVPIMWRDIQFSSFKIADTISVLDMEYVKELTINYRVLDSLFQNKSIKFKNLQLLHIFMDISDCRYLPGLADRNYLDPVVFPVRFLDTTSQVIRKFKVSSIKILKFEYKKIRLFEKLLRSSGNELNHRELLTKYNEPVDIDYLFNLMNRLKGENMIVTKYQDENFIYEITRK